MKRRHALTLGVMVAIAVAIFATRSTTHVPVPASPRAPAIVTKLPPSVAGADAYAGVGFRSRADLAEHFRRHGREFTAPDAEAYLRLAQALRDAPPSANVLELVRRDGTITRFDRASGAFIAFDPDRTLRTFFKPVDGERYFRRQAEREH